MNTSKTNKTEKNKLVIRPLFLLDKKPEEISQQLAVFGKNMINTNNLTLIAASNDGEAIAAFLQEFRDAPLTLQSYAKEIERLLLWCIHVADSDISSLRREHLMDYQTFLKNPLPQSIWCGVKTAKQLKDGTLNPRWRPFGKPLSSSTINKVLRVLDAFFNYLVQSHYLSGNPLAMDRRRKKRNNSKSKLIDRYLELDEVHATLEALDTYPIGNDITKKFQVIRARYIILLLFYTGLRISEAAHHKMGNFLQREQRWFLRVTGKGKKVREVPIPDALLNALADFRLAIGLQKSQPSFRERTPLIPMQNLKQSIGTRRIDQILKWAFSLGALDIESAHPRKASKLRSASAHWLRHSYVTYLLDNGASLKVAQENAGHSDVGTTMLYRHVAQTDRHAATKSLSLEKNSKTKQS